MQFVFDLDGTICFNGQSISETLSECLYSLIKQGHEVVFASARPIRDMFPVLNPRFYHQSLIGANGALVSKEGKLIHTESFSKSQVVRLLEIIKEHDASYLIDGEWDYAYTGPSDHPILKKVDTFKLARRVDVNSLKSVVKVLIITTNDMEILVKKLLQLDVVVHRHINENVIDISPTNINKWNALKLLGIGEKQFIAFGNDTNDVQMFQNALYSVMIGSHTELSKYASDIIPLDGDYEGRILKKIKELSKIGH